MDNNKNPYNNNNDNQPKMPKFNMNWIYALVAITLGILILTNGVIYYLLQTPAKKLTIQCFSSMLPKVMLTKS